MPVSRRFALVTLLLAISGGGNPSRAQTVERSVIVESLRRATQFMTENVADHGGYAWTSSADGRYSNGEGIAGKDRVWVQPPGTPAVGEAFLDAFESTGDTTHLTAARSVAAALLAGQLRSGGWYYSIEFAAEERAKIPYRSGPNGRRDRIVPTPQPGGWEIWRKRKVKRNQTILDDDTTPAAIRFLIRLDAAQKFSDNNIRAATSYALESTLAAQYPVGAWGHNYDRFPTTPPDKDHYPILEASYPDLWSRTSTNDFNGCYMLNDRITMNMIRTMLVAAEVYRNRRYAASARRGGEFLIRAQMPDPQPAWAQQYDRHMHPVWDRKFEPPAICGGESQDVLETLLLLYEKTRDKKFLQPFPRALAYLKASVRGDGRLARYYELKTNRAIYFSREYKLTYDDRAMPDHYGFIIDSRLDQIERDYQRFMTGREKPLQTRAELASEVTAILAEQRDDGAWLEPGFVRDQQARKVTPPEGVVQSQTFIDHVSTLCAYLRAK